MIKDIKNLLSKKSTVSFNEPMNRHTTFRVGGNAECFIVAESYGDLHTAVSFGKENKIPLFILGNGSNLLVSDKGVKGIVIKLGDCFSDVKVEKNEIVAGAGMLLSRVAQIAQENGLTGLEWAYGIPGTVGGAIFMNAGAYGGEMKDIVNETIYLNDELEFCKITDSEHNFGYRKSVFNDGTVSGIILRTTVRLKNGNKDEILAGMQEYLNSRITKQPLDMPSAGSVFKRPEGAFAGQMIEELGLKGFTIGGAQVSEKHAGFIVNSGNATAEDIKKLIKYIKDKVREKYNIELQTEVREVGE